ncbi:MAG: hypothetical protein JXR25_07835 [Pontiellaceae bacterium]|nr:hypothetical protein [Pontiellaceae bacterium]MBN2784721.1 hypothetical protein [Pontiellaceae bacterium]
MKRLLAILPFVIVAGCGSSVDSCCSDCGDNQTLPAGCATPVSAGYQEELLQLAFDGVSRMPVRPHIKNRSRAQQMVADACLEIDKPERALTYIEQIENWQRWQGYANVAYYFAGKGDDVRAQKLVNTVKPALRVVEERSRGQVVASTPNELYDSLTDWRYESVLSRVAETEWMIGSRAAERADAEVYGDVNASKINAASAVQEDATFSVSMARLRPFTQDPNFEIMHLGFVKIADLIADHYTEVNLIEFLESEVLPKTEKIPVFLRIDILDHLARAAVDNADTETANQLIDRIQALVDPLASSPQFHIPEAVRLIRLRHEAGQEELAQAELAALEQGYEASRERIVNMYRAELLCRMAESNALLGNPVHAIELYSRAVKEGQLNPNSRPRADDLNEICCSMAVAGVKPSAALQAELLEMNDNLGEPW